MYLPESDAKKTMCCGPLTSVGILKERDYNCVGSDCMAWRIKQLGKAETIGYCGLAGKPYED